MTAEQNLPSQESWRHLYDAAIAFKEAASWDWMQDNDIFGVKDPRTGEVGYCCVLGAAQELFGMTVYRGTEGLNVYLSMASSSIGPDEPDFLFIQRCLMADFQDREMLDKTDRDVIRSLGLKFRGPNEWPQFRSYVPGYFPWHLTEAEALFLAVALEQALNVCLRFRDNPKLLHSLVEGAYLVRTAAQQEEQLAWRDEWLQPEPLKQKVVSFEPLDEATLARIKKSVSPTDQVWEGDFFHFENPMKEQGRPFYPRLFVWAETGSGLLLAIDMNHPENPITLLRDCLIQVMEKSRVFPREIRVRDSEAFELLLPLAEQVRIKLVKTPALRAIHAFRQAIPDYLDSLTRTAEP